MVPWCPQRLPAGSSGANRPAVDVAAMRRQVVAAGRVAALAPTCTASPAQPLKELSAARGTLLAVLTVDPAVAGDPTGGCREMLTETASRAAAATTDPALDLPAVRVGAAAEFPGPGRDAAVRVVPACRGGGATGDDLPVACAGVRELSAGAAAAADHSGGDVHRVRLFLVVLHELGGACAAVRRRGGGAARAGRRTRSWSRSPATTATCSSTSSPGVSAVWGSSRR